MLRGPRSRKGYNVNDLARELNSSLSLDIEPTGINRISTLLLYSKKIDAWCGVFVHPDQYSGTRSVEDCGFGIIYNLYDLPEFPKSYLRTFNVLRCVPQESPIHFLTPTERLVIETSEICKKLKQE